MEKCVHAVTCLRDADAMAKSLGADQTAYLGAVWYVSALLPRFIFLTYETVLFLTMLENSVLPMGCDSTHATLNVTAEL